MQPPQELVSPNDNQSNEPVLMTNEESDEKSTFNNNKKSKFKPPFYYLGKDNQIFFHNPLYYHTLPCPSTCPSFQFAPQGLRRFIQMNFLLILPLALLFELVVLDAGNTSSPESSQGENHRYIISQLFGLFLVFALLIIHLAAASTDPGIIPPAKVTDEVPTKPTKIISEDGLEVEIDACRTCRILRPPRSGHCKECDHCVSFFDHHCYILEICVGQRNLRLFILWIFTVWITLLFAFVRTLVVMILDLDYQVLKHTHYGRFRIAACCIMLVASLAFWIISWFPCLHYISLSGIGALEKDIVNEKRVFIKWWEREWTCSRFWSRLCLGVGGETEGGVGVLPKSRIEEFYDFENGKDLVDDDERNREEIEEKFGIHRVVIEDKNKNESNEEK